MSASYNRLPIEQFGRHLLASRDLDPLYVAVSAAKLPEAQLHRWLLAYWCCYHAGAASYLSHFEGKDFFDQLLVAASNVEPSPLGDRWPRAKERRHWRGGQAIKCVGSLFARYGKRPEGMVEFVAGEGGTFAEVSGRAQEHVLFGPWIGFKCADMVERVLGKDVKFDNAAVFMFADPTKAAVMQYEVNRNIPLLKDPKSKLVIPRGDTGVEVIMFVANYLIHHFKEWKAPPFDDRPVNIQEIETILCKWKSHMNGHYPLYNDLVEISEGLAPWARINPTAAKILQCMPEVPSNAAK